VAVTLAPLGTPVAAKPAGRARKPKAADKLAMRAGARG
jgi:hypothetical protein